MRIFYKILICLLFFSCSAQAHGKNKEQKIQMFKGRKSAPAKVVAEFHKALKNNKKEKVLKLLDDSVLIYEGGGVERSALEYSSHHLLADMAFMSKMKVELLERQVEVYGNIAVSSSRSKVQGEYNKKKIQKTNMETVVLKKNSGKWKIIKIHWS